MMLSVASNFTSSRCRGFTLIELLVTMTIFSIIIAAFLGLFSSAFKAQRRNLASAYLLNNASYVTEYMSRALRMAKKDRSAVCISQNHNFYLSPGKDHIMFLNQDGECQEFLLTGNQIEVKKNGIGLALTPTNLKVEDLKFEILGESQTDSYQPRVTFNFKLIATTTQQEMRVQTTVSQRDLDIQYQQ